MDHQNIVQQLARAERRVADGRDHTARQERIIAGLEHDGYDMAETRALLIASQQSLSLLVAERDRLKQELADVTD